VPVIHIAMFLGQLFKWDYVHHGVLKILSIWTPG